MSLQARFLGSGSAFTDFRTNYNTAIVVTTDAGPFLIDCGVTVPQALKEIGVPLWTIQGLFLTHMHSDHMGGIEQLLWERFYTGPRGPGWLSTPIYGPNFIHDALRRSLNDCVYALSGSDGVSKSGGYEILVEKRLLHRRGPPAVIGGVSLSIRRTHHVLGEDVDKPCYGVSISREGDGVIYYTADHLFNPDIGSWCQADVILHDCTFLPVFPGTVHAHFSQMCTLPPEVRAKIILMHHTVVPEGIDVRAQGFLWAARRYDAVKVDQGVVQVLDREGNLLAST